MSPEPSPSQTVQADDRLMQLTAGRGPGEVAVIRLRHQGLTIDEIAARTGFNERTVPLALSRRHEHEWRPRNDRDAAAGDRRETIRGMIAQTSGPR